MVNSGVDFSSSTAGLFFHLIQLIPYLLGFSLKSVEIFSMVFWYSAVVISSFVLAKTVVPKNRIAQIIFVAIYSFNIYLFNTWENVKVSNLALVSSLPLFVSTVYLWSTKVIASKHAVLFLCLASILASGAGINPAYFAVIIIVLSIEAIFLKDIKNVAIAILVLVTVNFFWIFPLLNYLILNQTKSLADIGLTNWLYSLSENTSLVNIVRLQGAWDWYVVDKYGMPQYLPYALNYLSKLPFIVFSFCVPVLSFISFLFLNIKKRFWYVFFGILAFLGIFLGVGSHPPTGSIFIYLYNHVPFLSFFRSPWYIFTPLLTLAYAGLTALFFEQISLRAKNKKLRHSINILGFVFLLLYGLYSYPLITGKIFRPDKDGFYVKFPQHVWNTKTWLAEDKNLSSQRIISYPDDDLESFSWGYKGTESILGLFADREVIAPSFNIPSKAFGFLLKDFYSHLKREEYASAISILNFFGSDTIFYKKDSPTLSPPVTAEIDKFVNTVTFGDWSFMKVNEETNKKVYGADMIYNNLSYPETSIFQAPLLNKGAAVVNGTIDTEIAKIPLSGSYLVLMRADALGEKKEEINNLQKYRFTLAKDGLFDFAIEKLYVNKNDIVARIDSREIGIGSISEEEAFIKIGPVGLTRGAHILEISYPEAKNLLDIDDYSSYAQDSKLRKDELPGNIQKTLAAVNFANEDKVIKLPIKGFNPFLRYAVGFDYKYIYGSVPILDVIQSVPSAPVKTHPIYPGASFDWEFRYEIYKPVETDSKLELFIKLSPNKPGDRSKTYFEDLFIRRIYDNKVFVIERNQGFDKTSSENVEFRKVSPVKYEVKIKGSGDASKGTMLVFLESYNQGWVLKSIDKESGLKPLHFIVNGYANGWYVPGNLRDSNYVIYYQPQKLYLIGMAVSVITILLIVILNLFKWKK
ncbi:hypothetical protein COU95_02120, partial [Candidatus Shapirobacteria bacterium CG10_big_fil_rev_8_21_14_0_10_40_9]